MKKTLIAVAAAAALTTSAFAEITFGAWLRTLPTFVASNGDDTVMFVSNSWGGSARAARLDINAVAEDGKAGFSCGYFDPMDGGISDSGYAGMWVKPIDQVKLTVGSNSPDNNVGGYRRDFCYGAWNWIRSYSTWMTEGEGYLIDGVGDWGNHKQGALVEVFPTEGFKAYVHVPFNKDGSTTKVEDGYKLTQVGAQYNIEGVGMFSAVYIGQNVKNDAGDVIHSGDIGAAFELTAVENLFVGVGFKMFLLDSDKAAADAEKTRITLGVSYQINDDMKVYANGGYHMYNKGKNDSGVDPRFEAGAGVDYNLGNGFGLNADVRYTSKENDAEKSDNIAFLAGVTKGISSNGLIGAGFQAMTNAGGAKGDKTVWALPVRVEMWF